MATLIRTDPGHLRPVQGQRRRRAGFLYPAAHEGREKTQASRHSAQLRECASENLFLTQAPNLCILQCVDED